MTTDQKNPVIVCLTGSLQFKGAFEYIRARMALYGNIVLGPDVFPDSEAYREDASSDTPALIARLDALQLKKIEMADVLFVVNPGNVIEGTTKVEIDYAKSLGKPIYYHEEWYTPEYRYDDAFWQATNYPLPEGVLSGV